MALVEQVDPRSYIGLTLKWLSKDSKQAVKVIRMKQELSSPFSSDSCSLSSNPLSGPSSHSDGPLDNGLGTSDESSSGGLKDLSTGSSPSPFGNSQWDSLKSSG